MCGFVGFVNLQHHGFDHEECLKRMTAALYHRGPDDEGRWFDPEVGIALGHRRLSIVDLSPEGHQPMASVSGRYQIVFNGEIYNFGELRQELEALHSRFRGHSDTEVMLAAFEAWGLEASVKRFVGMFAFALWDRKERVLHLVRDRLGEKPLYYGYTGTAFLFGSELKALRAHPTWRGDLDRDSLSLFMRHNYIPAPYTIYRGVHKLLPGTIASIREEDLKTLSVPTPRAYWSARQAAEQGIRAPFTGNDAEAIEHLEELLRKSVRQQMIADVPLGAFLSGGIDSSTIVALMQAQSDKPVKTFSIGFNEEGYNEAEHAKTVAHHLGTDHTELYVTPEEAMAVIPKLPTLYDEPFSDSSQIPTFLVAQLARQHVTVSLSGDAGDELFAGYNRYLMGRSLWGKIGWMPKATREMASRALTAIPPATWDHALGALSPLLPKRFKQQRYGDKLHKLAEVLTVTSAEALYLDLMSHWKSPSSLVLGASEPLTALTDESRWAMLPEFTQRMMYLDSISYLPDDILVKVDRASMGVSLESRVPFLDHRVVEFAWQIPVSMKIREGKGKWLLRQVLYKYVPKELVERPKMGFGVPIDTWLRGPLRDWAEDLLSEKRLCEEGFFDPQPIREKWADHLSGRRNWQYYLWDVLMFQAWLSESGSEQAQCSPMSDRASVDASSIA